MRESHAATTAERIGRDDKLAPMGGSLGVSPPRMGGGEVGKNAYILGKIGLSVNGKRGRSTRYGGVNPPHPPDYF